MHAVRSLAIAHNHLDWDMPRLLRRAWQSELVPPIFSTGCHYLWIDAWPRAFLGHPGMVKSTRERFPQMMPSGHRTGFRSETRDGFEDPTGVLPARTTLPSFRSGPPDWGYADAFP